MESELKQAGGMGTAAAIDAGKRIGELEAPKKVEGVCDVPGLSYVSLPEGHELQLVDTGEYAERPRSLEQHRTLLEAKSFIEYFNLFKDGNSRLFGSYDSTAGNIVGVLDYHEAGENPSPRWGRHNLKLDLKSSPEMKTFLDKNETRMNQRQFAEFLEDNISSIVSPDASTILSAVKQFTTRRNVVTQSELGDDGNVYFALDIKDEGKSCGEVTLPREFVLGLRPFSVSALYEFRAVLRWSNGDNGVLFSYKLIEPEKKIEAAFNDIRAEVEKGCGLNVLV